MARLAKGKSAAHAAGLGACGALSDGHRAWAEIYGEAACACQIAPDRPPRADDPAIGGAHAGAGVLDRARERLEIRQVRRRRDAALDPAGGLLGSEGPGDGQAHDLGGVGEEPMRVDERRRVLGRDQAERARLGQSRPGRDVGELGMRVGVRER